MDISFDNYKILKKIINCEITSFQDFEMSKKQTEYCLFKINEYINSYKLPSIEVKDGKLLVPKIVIKKQNELIKLDSNIFLSVKDRIALCELIIESEQDHIFLDDLMIYFNISKNTAYNDIKELKEKLSEVGLEVIFERKNGYQIVGDELQIRKRINSLLYSFGEKLPLNEYALVNPSDLELGRKTIKNVEEGMNIQFVDYRAELLPYHLSIVVHRIKNGHTLNEKDIYFNELNDTFEFNTVYKIIDRTYNLNNAEKYYLTLLLLSVSTSKFRIVNSKRKKLLSKAIDEVIDNFEKNACIKFDEREVLHNNILQHMIAAYYRIRYDLTLNQDMASMIELYTDNKEVKLVESIVDKSIEPLNNFIEQEMPDIEKKFLALQFNAWIRRQDLIPLEKPRAIVVCSHGVTISNLMFVYLKEILPELDFVEVVSQRDLSQIDSNLYDVIFSTVEINSKKKVIYLKNTIELKDRNKIRERVMGELYGHEIPKTDLGVVYKTIDKYLAEEQAAKLKHQITNELRITKDEQKDINEDINLPDLITNINIINSVKDYKEAIELAFKPLLESKSVTRNYVNKIINNYDINYPNILFGQQIAIPHASSSDGSNELAMSILKINEGVSFGKDSLVKIVAALAPIDTSSHLKALIQLSNLAMDSDKMDELLELTNRKEIQLFIKNYCEREGDKND